MTPTMTPTTTPTMCARIHVAARLCGAAVMWPALAPAALAFAPPEDPWASPHDAGVSTSDSTTRAEDPGAAASLQAEPVTPSVEEPEAGAPLSSEVQDSIAREGDVASTSEPQPVAEGPTRPQTRTERRDARRSARARRLDDDQLPTGALELGLGVVSLLASGALVANGAWQLEVASRKKEVCPAAAECTVDGPKIRQAAAGLSFVFAVPTMIAGALLLAKGSKLRKEANQATGHAQRLSFSAQVGHFSGVSVSGRF